MSPTRQLETKPKALKETGSLFSVRKRKRLHPASVPRATVGGVAGAFATWFFYPSPVHAGAASSERYPVNPDDPFRGLGMIFQMMQGILSRGGSEAEGFKKAWVAKKELNS